jgi:hypothetical protein
MAEDGTSDFASFACSSLMFPRFFTDEMIQPRNSECKINTRGFNSLRILGSDWADPGGGLTGG